MKHSSWVNCCLLLPLTLFSDFSCPHAGEVTQTCIKLDKDSLWLWTGLCQSVHLLGPPRAPIIFSADGDLFQSGYFISFFFFLVWRTVNLTYLLRYWTNKLNQRTPTSCSATMVEEIKTNPETEIWQLTLRRLREDYCYHLYGVCPKAAWWGEINVQHYVIQMLIDLLCRHPTCPFSLYNALTYLMRLRHTSPFF